MIKEISARSRMAKWSWKQKHAILKVKSKYVSEKEGLGGHLGWQSSGHLPHQSVWVRHLPRAPDSIFLLTHTLESGSESSCHPHGRLRLKSRPLTSVLAAAGTWGVNHLTGALSCSLSQAFDGTVFIGCMWLSWNNIWELSLPTAELPISPLWLCWGL